MIGRLLCKLGIHKRVFKQRYMPMGTTLWQCQRCRKLFLGTQQPKG
jgi:hypothetical protein